MKFTAPASVFVRAIKRASLAVDRKPDQKLLSHLLIEAHEDTNAVRLAGSNSFLFSGSRCTAEVSERGAILVDQQRLFEIVGKFASEKKVTVTATVVEGALVTTVKSGSSQYKLPSLTAEGFPAAPKRGKDNQVAIAAKQLVRMLDVVAVSMANDDQRAHLSGVHFSWDGKLAAMLATNGVKLSRLEEPFESDSKGAVFLPHHAVTTIKKFADTLEPLELVTFVSSDSYISFFNEASGFACKLVTTLPVDYKRVLPTKAQLETTAQVNQARLLDALGRLRVVADEPVRFYADVAAGRVTLESTSERGQGTETLKAKCTGANGEIVLGIGNFVDVAASMPCEDMTIEYASRLPVLFGAAGNASWLGVSMPIVG